MSNFPKTAAAKYETKESFYMQKAFALLRNYSANPVEDQIKRETFTAAVKEAEIGEKIAMKRFDQLAEGFEKALENACKEVGKQGFSNAFSIKNKILKSCGYHNL